MTKIKICGIRRAVDVEYVNTYKPEYVGFVFVPGRERNVTYEQARELKKMLSPDICAVGVFVDSPLEDVIQLLNDNIIDAVQLHGHEDEAYADALLSGCARKDFKIIKAFVIKDAQDVARANAFSCDCLLLDGGLGQGETFDWSLVLAVNRPFFLAGGLSADNVREAVRTAAPYAVDVSSGVETDRFKDEQKIKTFIETVRSMTV